MLTLYSGRKKLERVGDASREYGAQQRHGNIRRHAANGGSQTITATDTATSSITGTSNSISVSPAAASHFAVSAPGSATAGSAFNFTVTALDPFNNTMTGYNGTVHFTSSDGSATLLANSTLSSSTGTFGATLKTAGSQTITATDTASSGITGTSNSIAASAAAATHFTVSAPSSATAGTAFNFTVTALDQFNNTATGYGGTVHFTSTDSGVGVTLPADTTLSSGTRTLSATLVTVGSRSITATDTGNSSITGTSNTVPVSSAGATHYSVAAPSSAIAGASSNFTVTALDAFNNVVTGYAGTVRFSSTDGSASLPGNSGLTGGVGTFSATLRIVGNQTITATDNANSSITGTSGNINVIAAPLLSMAFAQPLLNQFGATSLTYTLMNSNPFQLTGVGFSNPLPSIIQTTFAPGQGSTCGGALTVNATSVTLSGAILTAGASCTVVVGIVGTGSGIATNTATSTSDQTGPSPTPATALVGVQGRNGITTGRDRRK